MAHLPEYRDKYEEDGCDYDVEEEGEDDMKDNGKDEDNQRRESIVVLTWMIYSIFGSSPILATEALLVDVVVVDVVLPPMTTAGGLGKILMLNKWKICLSCFTFLDDKV